MKLLLVAIYTILIQNLNFMKDSKENKAFNIVTLLVPFTPAFIRTNHFDTRTHKLVSFKSYRV